MLVFSGIYPAAWSHPAVYAQEGKVAYLNWLSGLT